MRAFDYCQRYCNELFVFPGHPLLYHYFTPRGWTYLRETHLLDRFSHKLIKNAILELVSPAIGLYPFFFHDRAWALITGFPGSTE